MMKGKFISIGIISLLVLVTSAWAADINGKWVAKAPGGQGGGESEVTLIFKAEGKKLTGTLNNTLMPGEVAIEEGMIDGDKVSFSLKRNFGQSDMKVVWKGTIAGDEIKFTRGTEGGGMGGPGGGMGGGPGGGPGASAEIIAKRAK
ncbi:hypothetical protein ACFL1N_01260 [Thermodesulfobacteriota bacterium]